MSKLTLWALRLASDYEILRQTGVFITDPQYIDPDHLTVYLAFSAVCQKVPATLGITFPVWVWHTAHGKQKPKPDLCFGGFLPKGTMGVRIEFVIDKNLVLLSDFDVWHSVLNDWCYARTEKEFDDHDIYKNPAQS